MDKKNSCSHLGVLIVEDDPAASAHIARAIDRQSDMLVLDAVVTLAAARDTLLGNNWPDILLIDLGLPDGDGTELIRQVSEDPRSCEIMVITVFGDEAHVMRAVEAGATGYLLKEEDSEEIGKCIRQLIAGGSPISASIARHLLKRFKKNDERQNPPADGQISPTPNLTAREIEVLRLIAKGYNSAEISDLLNVTYYTVTSHVQNIYRKLSVHSRSEAIFEAVQHGLVQFNT